MAVNETLQPLTGGQLTPDPNVAIPEYVRRAAAAADELHKQAYAPPAGDQPAPPADQQPAPPADQQPAPPADQQPAPPADHADQQPPALKPGEENVTAEEWRHRFLSMQGRYNASVREKAGMEEQMRQLGQELVRTQALVQQPPQPFVQSPPTAPNHQSLITDEDRANYGEELIDLATRAARSAVSPELEALREENKRLTARVQNTGKREIFAQLDAAVPNWRVLNNDARFKTWLRLPNVYTGTIRLNMLRAAVDGAEAPKAIAIFKDFLTEAAATGLMPPAAQTEQPTTPAPRAPALDLETLAAPGRARPASGDSQVPSDKPIYTRAGIRTFYDEKRRGLWAGREADALWYEQDLIAAEREGRIR